MAVMLDDLNWIRARAYLDKPAVLERSQRYKQRGDPERALRLCRGVGGSCPTRRKRFPSLSIASMSNRGTGAKAFQSRLFPLASRATSYGSQRALVSLRRTFDRVRAPREVGCRHRAIKVCFAISSRPGLLCCPATPGPHRVREKTCARLV